MKAKSIHKFIILFVLLFFSQLAIAQENQLLKPADTVKQPKAAIQSVSEENKILVLPFVPQGMTVPVANSYANLLAQSLKNTERFEVSSPEDMQRYLNRIIETSANPELVHQASLLTDCSSISCGLQLAEQMKTNYVIQGNIELTPKNTFNLNISLVNVSNNKIEFKERVRFDDESIGHKLFGLASRIADNTPLTGQVYYANEDTALISLGKRDGLKVGDFLVTYRQEHSDFTNPIGGSASRQTKNIAIIKISRVNEDSSQGIYFQYTELPVAGNMVTTYINKPKQIQIIADVRKELDTTERHPLEVETVKVLPVQLRDQQKREWLNKIRFFERKRDTSQWFMLGGALATAYFFSSSQEVTDYRVFVSLGIAGYGSFNYFNARNEINDLVEEGKYKGYLGVQTKSERKIPLLLYQKKF